MSEQQTLPGLEPKTIKTKKQMSIGSAKYVNAATGETEEFTVIQKNVTADFNFHKIWLSDLLSILDSFGNKKIKLLAYLLKKMRNEDNSVSVSYAKIQKDTKISKPTIVATMKELKAADIIKPDDDIQSLYYFNPNLLVKGNTGKRQRLLVEYVNMGKDEEVMNTDDFWDEETKLIEEKNKDVIDADIIKEK